MRNKKLRRGEVAMKGGTRSKEGGATANLSSKESHILKAGPSLTEGLTVVTGSVCVCVVEHQHGLPHVSGHNNSHTSKKYQQS